MDRNYISIDFLTLLQKNNIKYLIRSKTRYFKQETEKMKTNDEIVEIARTKERMRRDNFANEETRNYAKENKIEVRIIKHKLKKGKEEYLITNVKEFSTEEIFEMYGKRWNIETLYDNLKNKFGLNVICIDKDTSTKTMNEAEELIENGEISYLFMFDGDSLNDKAKELLDKHSNLKRQKLHKLNNLSDEDRTNKLTYINIMNNNLDLIRQELYQ